MGKSNRRVKIEDEAREERALEQLKSIGEVAPPAPSTDEKQRQRKDRKHERTRLRDIAKEFNNG